MIWILWSKLIFTVFTGGCNFDRDPNYNIYEETPIGTPQPYGMIDTSKIKNLTLTGQLDEYFEVDPSDFSVLITKKSITRDITQISGTVECEGNDAFDDADEVWFFLVICFSDNLEVLISCI